MAFRADISRGFTCRWMMEWREGLRGKPGKWVLVGNNKPASKKRICTHRDNYLNPCHRRSCEWHENPSNLPY